MDVKSELKSLLAAGKTQRVVERLVQLTADDSDLAAKSVALSARYHQYLTTRHSNLAEPSYLDRELNHIHASAMHLIECLPSGKKTGRWNWVRISMIIGILAGIAGFTGYTLKDFFQTKNSGKTENPVQDTPATGTSGKAAPVNQAPATGSGEKKKEPQSTKPTGNSQAAGQNNGVMSQHNNDGTVHETINFNTPTKPKEEKNEQE